MDSLTNFFRMLFSRAKQFLLFFSIIIVSTVLTILLVTSTSQQQITNLPSSDSSIAKYGIYSTIPAESVNIFKEERYKEIFRLRENYLKGQKPITSACKFEYEELEEVCRQVFGSFSPSVNAMLVRGILTANGVYHPRDSLKHTYKIYTAQPMDLKIQNEMDLQRRVEDQPEFATILPPYMNCFKGRKLFELYSLRDNYLQEKNYVTKCTYLYNELPHAYKQAFGATAPSLKALLVRGTLTAHGQFYEIESIHHQKFKLITPTKMGLKLENNQYARTQ